MGVHLRKTIKGRASLLGNSHGLGGERERRQMVLHLQLLDQTNEGSFLVPSKTLPDSFQCPGGLLKRRQPTEKCRFSSIETFNKIPQE